MNQMYGMIQATKWINMVRLSGNTILTSGATKSIEGYSMRGLHKKFEFKTNPKLKSSFGSQGVSFHKIDYLGNYIANVGSTSFLLFSIRTQKTLKHFTVPESLF